MKIKLSRTEYVADAYCTRHNGPGWSNRLMTVVVCDAARGTAREVYVQPNDQSNTVIAVHRIATEVHDLLVSEVNAMVEKED